MTKLYRFVGAVWDTRDCSVERYRRDEQAEADVALANLVRNLPANWCLQHETVDDWEEWHVLDDQGIVCGIGARPEEALVAAKED